MSIEPGLADLLPGSPDILTDWTVYRECPICRAPAGRPCTAMFSTVRDGRPDGPPKVLQVAHGYRKHRRGR